MDTITQEVVSLQTEREPTSPLPPKRARTDCVMTNNDSGERSFEFPELLTFQKTEGSASLLNTVEENTGLICTAEFGCDDTQDGKYQCDDIKLNDTLITKVTTSHTDNNIHIGSSNICCITAEREFLHLGTDEQLPVIKTAKLPRDVAGCVLPESHTSNGTRADTSTCHDCKWLVKSLGHESPGGGSPPAGYDEDRRQGQNVASQIQAITFSLSEHGEVRCHSDGAHEDALHGAGIYKTRGQSAEVDESNQRGDKHGFSENIFLEKEEEEGRSHTSPSDYGGSKSSHSHDESSPCGNLAGAGKNDEKHFAGWESDVKENAAVCDGESKGEVNKNGTSSNPAVGECAEESLVTCDVLLVRNIMGNGTETSMNGTETSMSLEIDYLSGAKGGHGAGTIIADTWTKRADHTTQTPMPARRSREPIERDNDACLFSVIDPAIWSEAEVEEKCCNSESATGVELSPSIRVSMVQTLLPLYSNVRPSECNTKALSASEHTGHYNGPEKCKGEEEDTCQAGNEGTRHRKSHPSSSPHRPTEHFPTGDERKESPGTTGHLPEEHYQAGCFPINLNHLKTLAAECSQIEIVQMDGTTERKVGQEMGSFGGEMKTVAHVNSEESDDRLLQQNERHKVDLTEISAGNKSTLPIEDELGIELSCSTDYQHRNVNGDENGDEPLSSFTSLPPTDAVVPGTHYLIHGPYSQNAVIHTAQHCNDRSSPVPSAFVLPDYMPGGFDTFEKIRLSPDDDDADGPGNSLLLTSLLSKTSQQKLHHLTPGAESDGHKEISEEEEVEKCQGNMGNGIYNSGNRSCEVPSFISTTYIPALARPEQQPSSQSHPAFYGRFLVDSDPQSTPSTVSPDNPVSELNKYPEFEMKEQFDMVLRELSLYFEISTNVFSEDRAPSSEQCSGLTEPGEAKASNHRECLSSPAVGCRRDTSSDDDDNEAQSLEKSGVDPVISCTTRGCDREQEVPLDCSRQCQEGGDSMYSTGKHREPREMDQKSKMWSPSFTLPSSLEQLSHRQPDQPRRLEPLRTCTRPIRVGLSKKAKTKRLHCPHPYK